MTDREKIAQWISSDYKNNSPLYVDIVKSILPLYTNLTKEDIHYRIELENRYKYNPQFEKKVNYLRIFITDKCYREDYKHSMEYLICTDEFLDGKLHMVSNSYWVPTHSSKQFNVYEDTIFNYGYVMEYVREQKLNSLFNSN